MALKSSLGGAVRAAGDESERKCKMECLISRADSDQRADEFQKQMTGREGSSQLVLLSWMLSN